MKQPRWLLVGLALVLSAAAAYGLRDVIERTVIVPISYVWWVLGIFYNTLPQVVIWILLVVVAFLSAMGVLTPDETFTRGQLSPRKPAQGQIESLLTWLERSKRGNYYKWLIANRLGKLAREVLAQREGRAISKAFGRLQGRDWKPPKHVDAYLETGLNGSFAEFPQPRWPWSKRVPTPLDADPQVVIEYLEKEMESTHHGHR